MPFLDMCSDPSTVFRCLSHPAHYPAPLSPFFPTSLCIFLLWPSCCLSFPPEFTFSPPHPLNVRESSPFLLTCWEFGSLQGDGIRCRSINEAGCSPSYQSTDPLQSPADLVLLSLSSFPHTGCRFFPSRPLFDPSAMLLCLLPRSTLIDKTVMRAHEPPTYLRLTDFPRDGGTRRNLPISLWLIRIYLLMISQCIIWKRLLV